MKHPETHKRMTNVGMRRQRHAIANSDGPRRPNGRWLRRVFLRGQKDYVSIRETLTIWITDKNLARMAQQ